MFRARYIDKSGVEHWRTIRAGDLNEASRIAKRNAKKDWQLCCVEPFYY